MFRGRRIWQLPRVHVCLPTRRNHVGFKPASLHLIAAQSHARHASSSAFNLVTQDSTIADIHQKYHTLIDELKQPRNIQGTSTSQRSETAAGSILSAEELTYILKRLVESGRMFDMDLVVHILYDMQRFFDLDPKTVQPTIVDALIRSGNCHFALEWYLRLPKLPGHASISQKQWHALLELCGKQKHVSIFLSALARMGHSPRSGVGLQTLRIALQAGFYMGIDDHTFLAIFDELARSYVPVDPDIRTLLEENCPDDPLGASRILDLYTQANKSSASAGRIVDRNYQICQRLKREAELKDVQAAFQLFQTIENDELGGQGFHKKDAMVAIFGCAQSIQDLEDLSTAFKKPPNALDWSALITNLCWNARRDEALLAYRHARKQGIPPNSRMAKYLIKLLCRPTGRDRPISTSSTKESVPSKIDVDQAVLIYQDLIHSKPTYEPDTMIYQSLLGALSALAPREYYDLGISIIHEMASYNVVLQDSRTASAVIVWMMKNAQSYEEAFRIYRKLRGPLDGPGYLVVLNTFRKLNQGPKPPSMRYCFGIVGDMRASHAKVRPRVYAVILRHFTDLYAATPKQRDLLAADSVSYNRITSAIRRLDSLLTTDISLASEGNTPLWCQLMDTYTHFGCYEDAMRVWDSLYLSGQITAPGVSIILDSCGFSKSEEAARHVLANLRKAGFTLQQNNWRSWVECLCRVGNFDEALRVLCIDMASAGAGIMPDENTATVIRKFSRKHGLEGKVIKRIRQDLPGIWLRMRVGEGESSRQRPQDRLDDIVIES